MKEIMECDVCGKEKEDVRFEGLTESHICDSCLYNFKLKIIEENEI
jgi:hypothetical protein